MTGGYDFVSSVPLLDVPQSAWRQVQRCWFIVRHRVPGDRPRDAPKLWFRSCVRVVKVADMTATWRWADMYYPGSPGFLTLFSRGRRIAECRYKLVNDIDGRFVDDPVLLATNLHVNLDWRHCGIATAMLTYLLHHYPTATLAGEAMNPSSVGVHVHLAQLLPGRVHHQQRFHHLLGRPPTSPEIPDLFPEISNPRMAARAARYRLRRKREPSHAH